MSEASLSVATLAALRAGFGQRALALAIDLLLINLLIAVIGLVASQLTDGRVRVANTVLNVVECTTGPPVSPDLKRRDVVVAADARLCTRSVFGILHDWMLVVGETAKTGEDAKDRRWTKIPTDRTWRTVQAYYLDDVILVVLGLYMIILQWRFSTTIGKQIVGIRVQALSGAPLTAFQAGKRVLPTLIVLLAADTTASDMSASATASQWWINLTLVTSHWGFDYGFLSEGLRLAAFLYIISLVVAAARRTQPLHDQWAATEVVCSTRESTP